MPSLNLKITEKTPTIPAKMNPIINWMTLAFVGSFSFNSSVIWGMDPRIKPANKHTIENKQYLNAIWNGKTREKTVMMEPIKNGSKINKLFQKFFVNKLSTASTIFLNAPNTMAIVPPETPGTIIAVPIAMPVNPSLIGVGNFFFIDVNFNII